MHVTKQMWRLLKFLSYFPYLQQRLSFGHVSEHCGCCSFLYSFKYVPIYQFMGMCLAVGLPSGSSHLVIVMQLSRSVFVVHGATAAQQRQLRESAAAEAEAKKVAGPLGLDWGGRDLGAAAAEALPRGRTNGWACCTQKSTRGA